MVEMNILDGVYDTWVSVENFNLDAEIADRVQVIYCDTRDFAIGWNFEKPKVYKNPNCGLEYNTNKGLSKLYSLFKKQNREKYTIDKKDILKWLNELCQKTGGYDKDWRYLEADVDYCRNWNLKYIRFIRNDKNPNEFIVCNNYMFPICYKEIMNNLKGDYEGE